MQPTDQPAQRRPLQRRQPLAAQVERVISERLAGGEFEPGDQLPSEHELSAEMDVSRATIRAALTALTHRGLITSRQGIGNFVSEATRMTNVLTEAIDFHEMIARTGASPEVTFDQAAIAAASSHTAAALGRPVGTPIHRTYKRFAADGITVIYSETSIPVDVIGSELAQQLAAHPENTEPLFAFFADRSLATAYQVSRLAARTGSDVAYPAHTMPPDVAVIEMDEVGYTETNLAIWHSRNWYAPDSMSFEFVRRRPPDLPSAAIG